MRILGRSMRAFFVVSILQMFGVQLPIRRLTDVSFDPVRCAKLHNQLLAKVTSHIPGAAKEVKRYVLTRWLELQPDQRPTEIPEGSSLYTFLSLINSYEPDGVPLTAEYYQPVPIWFDNYYFPKDFGKEERRFILLYPDTEFTPVMDSGLYFDLDLNRVYWNDMRSRARLGDDEDWVPLELVLQRALDMWDIGKWYWGDSKGWHRNGGQSILGHSWIPLDLEQALYYWNRLLDAIEMRIPLPKNTRESSRLDPLPIKLLNQFKISSFAKAFLSAAKRPGFKHVAPGLTTLTPESFVKIYGNETPESRRQKAVDDGSDDIGSLILPASSGPIAQGDEDQFYDVDRTLWPFALTVSNWSGLYTDLFGFYPWGDGDGTTLVTARGFQDAIRLDKKISWAPPRSIRLADMFELWCYYLENGIWKIDSAGVAASDSWFTDPTTLALRKLDRGKTLR